MQIHIQLLLLHLVDSESTMVLPLFVTQKYPLAWINSVPLYHSQKTPKEESKEKNHNPQPTIMAPQRQLPNNKGEEKI